jgi:hypothetical protein
MKKSLKIVGILQIATVGLLLINSGYLNAKDFKLWGKQKGGWGHAVNARTEGNRITLNAPAKIISVRGNATGAKGYCFWSQTRAVNRAVLCGGTDRKHSLVGQILQPDTYTLFTRVGKHAEVRLRTVKQTCIAPLPQKALNKTLWGEQKAGWGHAVNASTKGNRITLNSPAKILHVSGNATGVRGFCLWKNRQAVLCGGTDKKHSIVGRVLQPGTYSVLPRAGTYVKIKF